MKLLVTGANGLLGQKLVHLLAPKVTLFATGKGPDRSNRNTGDYSYISADLTQKEEVDALIQQCKPDTVVHCAAMTQVDECELNQEACWQVNVRATEYLLAACKAVNAFFLYVSTDFVFDGKNVMLDESAAPDPISHYGKSKLKAEELVQDSNLNWAIVRTVLVYGVVPNMSRSNIVLWVKRSLEERKTIQVVNDQFRTPTLAEDLALGCWLVVRDYHQGIFHLSGDEMLTPYEIAVKTARFFGLDEGLITPVDASNFTQPGKRPPMTGFDISKAKDVLGFEPKTFEQGLGCLAQQLTDTGPGLE